MRCRTLDENAHVSRNAHSWHIDTSSIALSHNSNEFIIPDHVVCTDSERFPFGALCGFDLEVLDALFF